MANPITILRDSLYKGNSMPSSSRIMAYIMMLIIFIAGMTAVGIELTNAIIVWTHPGPGTYTIPTEHILILGMWLAHQLTLLGIYKNSSKSKNKHQNPNSIEKIDQEGLPPM